ncbi:HTTM domain-containing protein [Myxococcota bacterium]|nr:HTTM domain-containing protein [Myxococcota bacterium]
MGLPARLVAALLRPVDAAPLAWYRVALGLIIAWEAWRYLAYDWVGTHYVQPAFHFSYFPFDFVRPLPGVGPYLHMGAIGLLGLAVALGYRQRGAAILLALLFPWWFLSEQAKYLNHLYLVSLLSLLGPFLPLARVASLDARRRPSPGGQHAPAWALYLLRFQIGLVYVFGGIAKLNGDWLSAWPLKLWLAERADWPVLGALYGQPWAPWFFSYAGLLFDLTIPFLLWWRRSRALAVIAVLVFHVSNEIMFTIGIFPYLMVAVTPLFFEPDWVRRTFPRLLGPLGPPPPLPPRVTPRQRWGLGLLAAWVAVQLALPFRHWLYPGEVSWTEEGHLYAWHMKLRDKTGRVRFTLVDPETGERWTEDASAFLTPRQVRKLRTRPDLAHQTAHELARRARAEGRGQVQVFVDLEVSLNGRPRRPLIDPTVDLAAEPRSLWPKAWLLPLDEPLPTRLPAFPSGGGDD